MIKKILAGGMIILNLASPICAKIYNPGLETKMEQKYNVDLIGNFSDREIGKISNVMKNIGEKIDRKKNGIEKIAIENVGSQDERLWDEDDYASATIDTETNTILMSTAAINGKPFDRNPLADYEGLLGHETGHLIYPKYADEIFDKFWDFNIKMNRYKESKIPDGYVTAHPMERPFFGRANEDFADIFSYWINGRSYANKDEIVQKKLEKIKGYLGARK